MTDDELDGIAQRTAAAFGGDIDEHREKLIAERLMVAKALGVTPPATS